MGSVQTATIAPLTIVNGDIAPGAGIDASKLVHQQTIITDFGLSAAGTPTTQTRTVFLARSACTLRDFVANLTDTGTSTNIDFDLKKNGSTVLSAAVNFTHGDTDNVAKAGTITGTSVASGDYLTVVMTVTSSTGALGPSAQIRLNAAHV